MKRKVKLLKVNLNECVGCRMCELICAAFHSAPKYAAATPEAGRIRVFRDELKGTFVPIKGSFYTKAECAGRILYVNDDLPLSEYKPELWVVCSFCGASCPSRDLFKEPGTGLPLKCDMCESDPPLQEPVCVRWCFVNALTYEEWEEEVREEEKVEELEVAVESLIDRYGWDRVLEVVERFYSARAQSL